MGIARLRSSLSKEVGRYGVTVNAIAPGALTRMTEDLNPNRPQIEEGKWNPFGAENIAPLVVWLGSPEAREITGRVFNVAAGRISVAEGWVAGPGEDHGARWDPNELGKVVPDLVARAAPNAETSGIRKPKD